MAEPARKMGEEGGHWQTGDHCLLDPAAYKWGVEKRARRTVGVAAFVVWCHVVTVVLLMKTHLDVAFTLGGGKLHPREVRDLDFKQLPLSSGCSGSLNMFSKTKNVNWEQISDITACKNRRTSPFCLGARLLTDLLRDNQWQTETRSVWLICSLVERQIRRLYCRGTCPPSMAISLALDKLRTASLDYKHLKNSKINKLRI